MKDKAVRHNFMRLHGELERLNKELDLEISRASSRPIHGANSSLKKIELLRGKINRVTAEYLKAISDSIAYSTQQ